MVQLRHQPNHDRLSRARMGDEDAWRSIYEDLSGIVTGYLAGLGVSDAEDLAGEVFLQVAPNDFVTFMAHAQAIVTSFFHGCIFALLNEKPFVCENSSSRSPGTSTRAKVTSRPSVPGCSSSPIVARSIGDGQRGVARRPLTGPCPNWPEEMSRTKPWSSSAPWGW